MVDSSDTSSTKRAAVVNVEYAFHSLSYHHCFTKLYAFKIDGKKGKSKGNRKSTDRS